MVSRPPPRPPNKALRGTAKRARGSKSSSNSSSSKPVLPRLLASVGWPAARLPAWLRAVLFLVLAAAGSFVSQLTLSPVYGEIPSALHHDRIVAGVFAAAWLLRPVLRRAPMRLSAAIPVLVLYAPGLLHYLFGYSGSWGPVRGPVISEMLTYYPVLLLSVFAAAEAGSSAGLPDAVAAGAALGVFATAKAAVPGLLRSYVGASWALTRCGLHHVLGGAYAALSPSLLLATAAVAVAHSALENPLCGALTPAFAATLARSNHTLVARHESVTGYISVLDNFEAGYRVLRCDHSLLGGEWQHAPPGLAHMQREGFKEPIYAVFVIMEAVRLVQPAPARVPPRALAM